MELSGQPAIGFSPLAGPLLGLPLQSRQGERAQHSCERAWPDVHLCAWGPRRLWAFSKQTPVRAGHECLGH